MSTDDSSAADRGSGFSAGLGLAFPERDYVAYDPFDGDRDADVRCRTVKLVRARKPHDCMSHIDGRLHTIKPGELYRYEKALIDGDYWGEYRICIACMDEWLTEIDRPRAASPNVLVTGKPPRGVAGE